MFLGAVGDVYRSCEWVQYREGEVEGRCCKNYLYLLIKGTLGPFMDLNKNDKNNKKRK